MQQDELALAEETYRRVEETLHRVLRQERDRPRTRSLIDKTKLSIAKSRALLERELPAREPTISTKTERGVSGSP